MKAWILSKQSKIEENPLQITELPKPHPRRGEIGVRIITCGICRTDLHIAEGDLPLKKSPIVLGHEIVGYVDELGEGTHLYRKGDLVGISWLNSSCGKCQFCKAGKENYCPEFKATGWDVDGGFAEYTVVNEKYAFPLNDIDLSPDCLSPLMCPGIAGQCAFNLTEIDRNSSLGIFGFGPTAYYLLKIARFMNIDVYVSTRSKKHQIEAIDLGAVWAKNIANNSIPVSLDSAIVFPPVGEFVEIALKSIKRGGNLVLSPVYMTPITIENYSKHLWGKNIKTLYNVNRRDGMEFLKIAKKIDMRIPIQIFPFDELDRAMILMKKGQLDAPVAVLRVSNAI